MSPEAGPGRARWRLACLAAAVLNAPPPGLGGVVVRARPGPVRDRWLSLLSGPLRRLPPGAGPDALDGGLDLAATLGAGRAVSRPGLLAESAGGLLLVPMAERLDPGVAARLGMALDGPEAPCLVLIDEGAEPDETAPPALTDRLALHIDLGDIPLKLTGPAWPSLDSVGVMDAAPARPDDPATGAPMAHGIDPAGGLHAMPLAVPDPDDTALGTPGAAAAQPPPPRSSTSSATTKNAAAHAPQPTPGEATETLTRIAVAFGIGSLRAPLQALGVARALSGTHGHGTTAEGQIDEAAIADAVALSLAPRATRLPASEQDPAPEPPPPPPDPETETERDPEENARPEDGPLEDRVLEAVAALLPDLALNSRTRQRGRGPRGAGARQAGALRGRPKGSHPGRLGAGKRIDLLATLRAAAPWQRLRPAPSGGRLAVRAEDLRIRRFERPAESVTLFLVDASGSSAAARMAEAKGAIELMLAEAYRRREKVALIAFRGAAAELVLPPTRALVQAKRRLAGLAAGGGTPLAAALQAGHALARQIRQRGATPYLVVLTDGRGNIALDGTPGRSQAAEDQALSARLIAAEGLTAVLIDTGNRPQPAAADLARQMGARYLALPRADAAGISRAVRAATQA